MSIALAMLVQNEIDLAITSAAFIRQFREDWPDARQTAFVAEAQEEGTLTYKYGNFTIAVMSIEKPMADVTAELCASSRLWPDGRQFNTEYQAHTIVTILPEGDDKDRETSVLLSQVVASLVAISPETIGVYWAAANHLIAADLFRRLAKEVLPAPLFEVWVALNVGQRPEDGAITAHTVGLNNLGLMDVEIPNSTKDAAGTYEFLTNIALYLLDNGLIIKDGDTVGESAEERIKAIYAGSLVDPLKTVIQLQGEMKPQQAALSG